MDTTQQNELLTPEERLRLLGDRLLASILKNSEVSKKNKSYIFSLFDTDVFRNENYLLYYTLYRFRDLDITMDNEFLEMYLLSNIKVLKEAGNKIDLLAFKEEGQDENISYIGATIKQFNRLQGMQIMDTDAFKLTCEKYRITFMSIEAGRIYSTADRILNVGLTEGRRDMMGYEDSKAYINREFARIDAISSRDAGEGFVSMRGFEESEDKKKIEKITDWGITELDNAFGGIFTGWLINILAPPKNGKTKFCANIAHRACVENGAPIVVWAPEGGRKAFDSQLRAKHFSYKYNKDVTEVRKKKVGVDANIIRTGQFPNEELRQLEDASRIDLYNNPKHGEVLYIEMPFILENLISDIDTAVQTTGAKLVVIDYAQLISSDKYKRSEAVTETYKALLQYVGDKNVTILTPAQYTQEFIKEVAKNGEGKVDTRTAGAESSEVIRAADINVALWASEEDLIRGQMDILSIPSRASQTFPKFTILHELGCCDFYNMPSYMKMEGNS